MKEYIEEIYVGQRNARAKLIMVSVSVMAVMIGVVSFFEGNPFTHKESMVIFERTVPGWISTDSYLLLLCGAVGIIVGIGNMVRGIFRQFIQTDRVLLQECDAKRYLEMMEYMVSYGKGLKCNQLQRCILHLAEQKYVTALIINEKYEEAEGYLAENWVAKEMEGCSVRWR